MRAVFLLSVVASLMVLATCEVSSQSASKNLNECKHKIPDVPKDWIDMVEDPCEKKMREQIKAEFNASMQYMAMGAYFSKDNVNRPGFAKFFFNSASEEREHAIKLIDYLNMRGKLTKDVKTLLNKFVEPTVLAWRDGVSALKFALNMEAEVTKKIRSVIIACENDAWNDYHLVDYLTGEFLEEQYKGQRDIAGKISTLDKMMDKHGALGEWLFDKKLLD